MQEKMQWAQTGKQELEHPKTLLQCVGDRALAQGAQRGCGEDLLSGGLQKLKKS